jgi:hypothetical protein
VSADSLVDAIQKEVPCSGSRQNRTDLLWAPNRGFPNSNPTCAGSGVPDLFSRVHLLGMAGASNVPAAVYSMGTIRQR